MKRTFWIAFCTILLATWSVSALAQSCTSQKVGNYTYTNCSDASSATTSQVGNYSYTNTNSGTSITGSRVGNYTYYTAVMAPLSPLLT